MIIPFKELLEWVMLRANKNAGAPLPKIPVCSTVKSLFLGTLFQPLNRNGIAHKNETEILKLANSTGVKAINPFLIRMYELPHITVSRNSSNQFCGLW